MRPCTPTQDAPAPRESAFKSIPHPAAPVGEPSQTRRHHLTPTPVSAEGHCTGARPSAFLFGPCTARFSFGKTKEKWGVHPRWTSPLREQNPPPLAAVRRPLRTQCRVRSPSHRHG